MRRGEPVAIATPRLRLRGVAVRDAASLRDLMGKPGVPDWLKISRAGWPLEPLLQMLRGPVRRSHRFAVTLAQDDRLIGLVGLSREARLHYVIDPDHWGRGIATEAVGSLLPLLFAAPTCGMLEAEVFDANPASARVLQKLGFTPLRRTTAQRPGHLAPEPSTIYALERACFGSAA